MRRMLVALALLVGALVVAWPSRARADEIDEIFARANAALAEGRAGDAIRELEALADRGVVDPGVSYDRGLAYAARVRIGAEQPGDLGRAAHGFEETRALLRAGLLGADARLDADAVKALAVVRAEVARRRARAGEPADVERGSGAARAIVSLLSEDAWCILALCASVVLGASLFARGLVRTRQGRAGATIGWAVSAPLLVVCAAMALGARNDRKNLEQAVVVSAGARPADEKGIALGGATPLPEGALVELVDARPGLTRVRWGGTEAWVPQSNVRPLARAE